MNTLEKHMANMASLLRQYRNGQLTSSTESDSLQGGHDLEVIANVLDPTSATNGQHFTHAEWVSDGLDNDDIAEPLRAALDEYKVEDDILELENIVETNEFKIGQIKELKDIIQTHWDDGVNASDIAKLNIADESLLRAYHGRKLPLSVAMEAIDVKTAGLAAAGLAALIALIWKIWTVVKARFGKGANSEGAQKIADDNIEKANESVADTVNSTEYNPKHHIKTSDLEEIFGSTDNKPDDFLKKHANIETVTVEEFTKAYIKEVVIDRMLAEELAAISAIDRMKTYTTLLSEMGKRLPKVMEVGAKLCESYNSVHDGGKIDNTIISKYEDVLKQLSVDIKQIDKIKDDVYKTRAAPESVSHNSYVRYVNSFGKVSALTDEFGDKITAYDSELSDLVKNKSASKISGDLAKKHAETVLNKIKEINNFMGKYQTLVNGLGRARLKSSVSYKNYAKALAKAYDIKKKSD